MYFSIITPVYNAEKYLNDCILSVLNQSFRDFEFILIDNNSTDNSLDIIKYYASKDSRIVIEQEFNKGPSFARNRGINIMSGKYVLFLDSDDFLDTKALSIIFDKLKNSNVDVLMFSHCHFVNQRISEIYIPYQENAQGYIYMVNSINSGFFKGCTVGKVYSCSFLKNNQIFFNTSLYNAEDQVFIIECLALNPMVSAIKDNLYFYRKDVSLSITSHFSEFDFSICSIYNILNDFIISRKCNNFIADNSVSLYIFNVVFRAFVLKSFKICDKRIFWLKRVCVELTKERMYCFRDNLLNNKLIPFRKRVVCFLLLMFGYILSEINGDYDK